MSFFIKRCHLVLGNVRVIVLHMGDQYICPCVSFSCWWKWCICEYTWCLLVDGCDIFVGCVWPQRPPSVRLNPFQGKQSFAEAAELQVNGNPYPSRWLAPVSMPFNIFYRRRGNWWYGSDEVTAVTENVDRWSIKQLFAEQRRLAFSNWLDPFMPVLGLDEGQTFPDTTSFPAGWSHRCSREWLMDSPVGNSVCEHEAPLVVMVLNSFYPGKHGQKKGLSLKNAVQSGDWMVVAEP